MTDMTQDKAMMRLYEHLFKAKRPETKFVGLGEDERKGTQPSVIDEWWAL